MHANMLLRTWQQLEYRLDIVPATKVVHSEVYKGKLQNFESLTISHNVVQMCSSVC